MKEGFPGSPFPETGREAGRFARAPARSAGWPRSKKARRQVREKTDPGTGQRWVVRQESCRGAYIFLLLAAGNEKKSRTRGRKPIPRYRSETGNSSAVLSRPKKCYPTAD